MLNLQKNYLEKYQQIYPENPQWNIIEYRLQLNLGNSSAYLKKVYTIVNPYLSAQFERENKGMLISEVYVKPQNLVESNRIQRVCQKGYQFSQNSQGLIFNVGQISIDPNSKPQHQLLVAKICPRRIYPCIQQAQGQQLTICPQGFDSIYYQSKPDQQTYSHRFRLYKKIQILPYYVIQFGFRPEHQKKLQTIMCQNCQDQPATFYCKTQSVYFCKKCQYQHHKNKISAQHQRTPLTDKPILDFGQCIHHKSNKNELFCRDCNVSMCMSCKIYGDHSGGFMANHQLWKIIDYYNSTTKKINEMDPNLQKRKDQLQQLLAMVGQKVKQINITASKLQNELHMKFQEALKNLQTIVHRKLSYLLGDQFQIRRQYDFIQWMESFLKYQYRVVPPNDFLIAWTKHQRLRKDVLNLSNIPPLTDVKADFAVVGQIDILQGKYRIGSNQWKNDALQDHQQDNPTNDKNQSQFRKKIFTLQQQPKQSMHGSLSPRKSSGKIG